MGEQPGRSGGGAPRARRSGRAAGESVPVPPASARDSAPVPASSQVRAHGQSPAPNPGTSWSGGTLPALSADQVGVLVHELANLLQGSMKHIELARRGLCESMLVDESGATSEQRELNHTIGAALRSVQTTARSLGDMAEMVRAIAAPERLTMGGARSLRAMLGGARDVGEAVRHAIELLEPLAFEHGVELSAVLDPALSRVPAAPVFPVVLNAVRNAIEAIGATGASAGRVEVHARVERAGTGATAEVCIDVLDDGPGLDPGAGERAFAHGFTTKRAGMGIGLALARDIVERDLGGTIRLSNRANGGAESGDATCALRSATGAARSNAPRGARLSIRYPASLGLRSAGAA